MTNAQKAIDAFIATKLEIDDMLARLAAMSDDHFNTHPDEINWADVGTPELRTAVRKSTTVAAG